MIFDNINSHKIANTNKKTASVAGGGPSNIRSIDVIRQT